MTSERDFPASRYFNQQLDIQGNDMNSIIWWVGFIVILLAVLSFVGLR